MIRGSSAQLLRSQSDRLGKGRESFPHQRRIDKHVLRGFLLPVPQQTGVLDYELTAVEARSMNSSKIAATPSLKAASSAKTTASSTAIPSP